MSTTTRKGTSSRKTSTAPPSEKETTPGQEGGTDLLDQDHGNNDTSTTPTPEGRVEHETLASALAGIMAECPKIAKDAEVTAGGGRNARKFRYASLEAILPKIVPLMARHGVVIGGVELIHGPEFQEYFSGRDRGKSRSLVCVFRWRLQHTSGEYQEYDSLGACRETNADKAYQSCMTYSYRFFLARALMLDTGDVDSDHPTMNVEEPDSRAGRPGGGGRGRGNTSDGASYRIRYPGFTPEGQEPRPMTSSRVALTVKRWIRGDFDADPPTFDMLTLFMDENSEELRRMERENKGSYRAVVSAVTDRQEAIASQDQYERESQDPDDAAAASSPYHEGAGDENDDDIPF